MASERALQMFPTMSSVRKKASVRHGNNGDMIRSRKGLPEFEMLSPSGKVNGVVIQITEGRPSTDYIPPPPKAPPPTRQAPLSRPQPPPLTIPPKAHITDDQRPVSPPSPLLPSPPQVRAPSPAEVPLPRSSTNTPTFSRNESGLSVDGSPAVVTPVMRSMFPRYNPSRPLARQSYYPNEESVPGLASAMAVAGLSSNNPYRQQGSRKSSDFARQSLEGINKDSTSLKESPLKNVESTEQQVALSNNTELLELWAISNGQEATKALESYTLELSCDDLAAGQEIITFNAANSEPLYTLETSNDNITVSRIHPTNRSPKIQVSSSVLSRPTSTEPLVSCIFPKLAGLMALDQSSNVAVTHKLSREDSTSLQSEAIIRAQDREAGMLLWDDSSNKYCLMHPTLLDSSPTTFSMSITPTPSNPSKITISAPETGAPLLELSLPTLSLTIHASAIAALPSLYILDMLMTTLLTLLLHLHRSCTSPNPQLSSPQTPMFPPPPTLTHKDSRSTLRGSRSYSRLSIFRSTKSMKSTRSLHSASAYEQDVELQSLPPAGSTSERELALGRKHQPPKQIFSSDDENLPKMTRATLKFLYWIFEVVFWVLSVLIQLLAAGVVGMGKLITKL